jgi:ATP-dependent RNA circularization protein (DNA/RNA ligase family)
MKYGIKRTTRRNKMNEYQKINTIFKRDRETNKIILGDYSCPEFEYLKDNLWTFTEKIDGTNVRVMWENGELRFGGKTDNANMPTKLFQKLTSMFDADRFMEKFEPEVPVCLYGEGFGSTIQKGGGNYGDIDFILFDIKIGHWWLKQEDILEIANFMNIKVVPDAGTGTLQDAIEKVRNGFYSAFGNFIAEGIVAKPLITLLDRSGQRIITKIKNRDFK